MQKWTSSYYILTQSALISGLIPFHYSDFSVLPNKHLYFIPCPSHPFFCNISTPSTEQWKCSMIYFILKVHLTCTTLLWLQKRFLKEKACKIKKNFNWVIKIIYNSATHKYSPSLIWSISFQFPFSTHLMKYIYFFHMFLSWLF